MRRARTVASTADSNRSFPTTIGQWMDDAITLSPNDRQVALGKIIERYLPVLKNYVARNSRRDANWVDDCVQSFVVSRFLEQNLVLKWDRERGRFRTFLRVTLRNFVVDQLRRESGVESLSDDIPAPETEDPEYDHQWTQAVTRAAIERMREECLARGQDKIWCVFHARVAGPVCDGTAPPSYEDMVKRCGFISPKEASNAYITASRKYKRILEDIVGEYAGSRPAAKLEIADLLRQLGIRAAGRPAD